MRLIADSGSTKTDWVLTDKGQVVGSWKTQGINPCHQQPAEIRQVLCTEAFLYQTASRCPIFSFLSMEAVARQTLYQL